jgi:hypothetical protein
MTATTSETAATNIDLLSDSELAGVHGGNSISILTTLPGYRGPKIGPPAGSIAQGDTLDNTLTFNGLP